MVRTLLLAVLDTLARWIASAQAKLTADAAPQGCVNIEILRDGVCIARGVQVAAGWAGSVERDIAEKLIEIGFARRV